MGMMPEEFFESFVEGNCYDCRAEPGDVRRAFNAAVAASHFADHYYNFNKRHDPDKVSGFPSLGSFVEHLVAATDGAFRDIRSISNAYKHLYTDDNGRTEAFASVNSSGAIESVELVGHDGLAGIEESLQEMGDGSGFEGKVVFTRKDGSKCEFLPILDRVVNYLRGFI